VVGGPERQPGRHHALRIASHAESHWGDLQVRACRGSLISPDGDVFRILLRDSTLIAQLCTIPDVRAALREMRRVLRPSGQLLFVEHGRSPDENVRSWQDRLTPFWKRVAGGCHLNRSIPELLEQSGFRIEQIETGYMKGPKLMTFMYEGKARPV